MHPDIAGKRPALAELCQRFGAQRLEPFGSAVRDGHFDPARSDIDFLVSSGKTAASISQRW